MPDEDKAVAIRVVENIVERILRQEKMQKVISGVQQILELWKYIPDELKRKVYFVFEKVWKKKAITFSTEPELSSIFFGNEFQNEQIKKIYESISDEDASALLLGLSLLELINRGQHTQSDELKQSAYKKYGEGGLTITNLVTTKDIYVLIEDDDISDIENKDAIKKQFEWWVKNYTHISVLISPENLQNPSQIEKEILDAARSLKKKYIIINMCADSIESIEKLTKIIEKMQEDKRIKYSKFEKENISESGFYFSFKGFIRF